MKFQLGIALGIYSLIAAGNASADTAIISPQSLFALNPIAYSVALRDAEIIESKSTLPPSTGSFVFGPAGSMTIDFAAPSTALLIDCAVGDSATYDVTTAGLSISPSTTPVSAAPHRGRIQLFITFKTPPVGLLADLSVTIKREAAVRPWNLYFCSVTPQP